MDPRARPRSLHAALLVLVLGLSACGSGTTDEPIVKVPESGLAGMYMQVASSTTSDGCTEVTTTHALESAMYFRLTDVGVDTTPALKAEGCLSPTDTVCKQTPPLHAFAGSTLQPIGDGSYGADSANRTMGTAMACGFAYVGVRLRRLAAGKVEIRIYYRGGTRSVAVCDTTADSQILIEGRTLPCYRVDIITGQRQP